MRIKKGKKLVNVVRGNIDVQVWQMTASCPFGKNPMVGTFGCVMCQFYISSDSDAVECAAVDSGVLVPGTQVKCTCDEFYGLCGVVKGLVDCGDSYVVRLSGSTVVLDHKKVRAVL